MLNPRKTELLIKCKDVEAKASIRVEKKHQLCGKTGELKRAEEI